MCGRVALTRLIPVHRLASLRSSFLAIYRHLLVGQAGIEPAVSLDKSFTDSPATFYGILTHIQAANLGWIRTNYLFVLNEMLYHMSYSP